MPTTILDGETYEQARHRRFTEEAKVIEKMQQDEIIRMAIDAGLGEYLHLDGWRFTPDGDDIKSLEHFYELAYTTGAAHEQKFWMAQIEVECNEAVLAERETCAKVCEERGFDPYIEQQCAAAIRGLK